MSFDDRERESNMRWDGRDAENAPDLNNRQDHRDDRDRPRDREREREEAMAMAAAQASPAAPPRPVIVAPDLSNMRRFLTTPVPQCYIRRRNCGTNAMYPIYSMFLKEGDVFLDGVEKASEEQASRWVLARNHSLDQIRPSI